MTPAHETLPKGTPRDAIQPHNYKYVLYLKSVSTTVIRRSFALNSTVQLPQIDSVPYLAAEVC